MQKRDVSVGQALSDLDMMSFDLWSADQQQQTQQERLQQQQEQQHKHKQEHEDQKKKQQQQQQQQDNSQKTQKQAHSKANPGAVDSREGFQQEQDKSKKKKKSTASKESAQKSHKVSNKAASDIGKQAKANGSLDHTVAPTLSASQTEKMPAKRTFESHQNDRLASTSKPPPKKAKGSRAQKDAVDAQTKEKNHAQKQKQKEKQSSKKNAYENEDFNDDSDGDAGDAEIEKVKRELEELEKRVSPNQLGDLRGTTSALSRKMTTEEHALMLYKRKLRNRLSAARSRKRHQQTLLQLQTEIDGLNEQSNRVMEHCETCATENGRLRQDNMRLYCENMNLRTHLAVANGSAGPQAPQLVHAGTPMYPSPVPMAAVVSASAADSEPQKTLDTSLQSGAAEATRPASEHQ
mmetsp:Transcript_10394/g.18733  ORF Transcript_10394/g.18733 Transcript_10394/m.18733 type:complete len:406 (+) Transcript_10394:161-1378(+)